MAERGAAFMHRRRWRRSAGLLSKSKKKTLLQSQMKINPLLRISKSHSSNQFQAKTGILILFWSAGKNNNINKLSSTFLIKCEKSEAQRNNKTGNDQVPTAKRMTKKQEQGVTKSRTQIL